LSSRFFAAPSFFESHFMIASPTDDMLRSLARAVARGQSTRSWAKQHHTQVELADAWRTLPEMSDLVETHRLQIVDRLNGKLLMQSTAAVDQSFTVSRRSPSDVAKISATRLLVDRWLSISLRFEATKKLADFRARMSVMENEQKNQASQGYGQLSAATTSLHGQSASTP
jgi:hypothetical protein